MARPSEILKTFGDTAGKVFTLFAHANAVGDVINVFRGGAAPTDAHAFVRGLEGIFGHKEEGVLWILTHKLNSTTRTDAFEVLSGFNSWIHKSDTLTEAAVNWWDGNAFRVFITRLGHTEDKKVGETVSTTESTDAAGVKTRSVTTTDVIAAGTDNRLLFLEWMVDTINSVPPAANGSRIAGYKKLVKQLEGLAVPHPSAKTVNAVEAWLTKVTQTAHAIDLTLSTTAAALEAEADRREAVPPSQFDKLTSPLDKLINWI